jgi:hypothetical protein
MFITSMGVETSFCLYKRIKSWIGKGKECTLTVLTKSDVTSLWGFRVLRMFSSQDRLDRPRLSKKGVQ